ncbi:recombinase family protein [Actinomadura sp. WAC 06369]|uniref:recombinase family protein n=1 Tax=Actinomadura sp. WAC 06369 TaxID=2203193 RepID=UPI0013159A61|nr:recombinase family protein [Actinomadura sp. WAC 06369]
MEIETEAVADYLRISLDKTGAALGVGSQHEENEEFAEEHLGTGIGRSYSDNDTSAFSGVERPGYQALMAAIKAGRVKVLIIWHANRLHRNTEELPEFIRVARAAKLKLYATSKGEAYNLEKAAGRKALRDDTSEAEYESEHRGERVALARKRQARNGDHGGGPRPFGWGVDTGRVRSVCINPKAPTMERVYEDRPVLDMTQHNPTEAAEIRRWADDSLAGVPMSQILASLAERKVPTVSQADGRTLKRNGKQAEHGGWDARTIIQILTHPRTSGHSVYRGKIVKRNAFPAIIPEDVRQALITKFADPARKTSPGNTPKWLGSLIYRCGKCDNGAVLTVRRNKQGTPLYQHNGHCQWPAEELDQVVSDVIVERLSRKDAAGLIAPKTQAADIAAMREEIVTLEARKTSAARMFARGALDEAGLEEVNATADADLADVRAKLDEATSTNPLAPFAASTDVRATWEGLSLGRKREVLRYLLRVTPGMRGRGVRHVDTSRIDIRRAPRQPQRPHSGSAAA